MITQSLSKSSRSKTDWLLFIALYTACISLSYQAAGSLYTQVYPDFSIFGYAITESVSFSHSMFIELIIGAALIGIVHLSYLATGRALSFSQFIMLLLLMCAVGSFILGINLPILKTTKFWFINQDNSLLQTLQVLYSRGELLLFLIVLAFTFLLPIAKLLLLCWSIFFGQSKGSKQFLNLIAKWSMLDVLVVAAIVVTMKSGKASLVNITSGEGITYFTVSVLLTLLVSSSVAYFNPHS